MSIQSFNIINRIFIGCNYNDKAIKKQFDSLKQNIEKDTAWHLVIIDKRAKKHAADIWNDIKIEISACSACFFDVTAFRPNVVLELGYSFSNKNDDQIFITFRARKNQGMSPNWLLSDIGHLRRLHYKNLTDLEKIVREQIKRLPFEQFLQDFYSKCDKTSASAKYKEYGVKVLQAIRDEGEKTDTQIRALLFGSNCHLKKMVQLLKSSRLLKRGQGRNAKWSLYNIN